MFSFGDLFWRDFIRGFLTPVFISIAVISGGIIYGLFKTSELDFERGVDFLSGWYFISMLFGGFGSMFFFAPAGKNQEAGDHEQLERDLMAGFGMVISAICIFILVV